MQNQNPRWIEASDVIPMFPTLVWKIQLEQRLHEAIDAKVLAALVDLRRNLPPLAAGSGWQSVQTLHERDDFRDLVACVHDAAQGILRFLRISHDEVEISACWATVLAAGASHRIHSHPNNFLSGVYYVLTHEAADTINFHDPRIQTGIIRPPVAELTAENTDQVVVNVKSGTLIVFPAWLQHSVDTNASEHERVSVSFNVMFSAFTERLSKPLW
jgi:uncharacterized protein (TIGR02466 family)